MKAFFVGRTQYTAHGKNCPPVSIVMARVRDRWPKCSSWLYTENEMHPAKYEKFSCHEVSNSFNTTKFVASNRESNFSLEKKKKKKSDTSEVSLRVFGIQDINFRD